MNCKWTSGDLISRDERFFDAESVICEAAYRSFLISFEYFLPAADLIIVFWGNSNDFVFYLTFFSGFFYSSGTAGIESMKLTL